MPVAMVLEVDKPTLSGLPHVEEYLRRLRERASYKGISPATKVAQASERA